MRLFRASMASILVLVVLSANHPGYGEDAKALGQHLEFFEKEVRPLLVEHCFKCHSSQAEKVQAGLKLDSREAMLRGGDSGQAVVPGEVDASLIIEAVRYESYEMPPVGKLPAKDVHTLERWVEMGAPWPEEAAPGAEASRPEFGLEQRKAEHWVWQPVRSPLPPKVIDLSWPRNDIDCFILERLEQSHLQPAKDADRSALLRRLYFDLIGLPPTPSQIEEFLNDASPQALENLVDRLLDSPHFGERWGRHWLDLVRYAESRGHEFDNDAPNAYQYRDYVIRAFNADVPYDQIVREHIAGDLLGEPRLNPKEGFNESILGTGFWFFGEWVHSPVDIRKDEADRFDNMIDVMSKTFLGVTVACARCHDHKFDAISTADYYSLSGFLQSSDYRQVRFESMEHNRRVADELACLDAKYRSKISEALAERGVTLPVLPSLEPTAHNAAQCVVVDYDTILPTDYLQDGYIFGSQPRRAGEAWLELNDDQPKLRFATGTAAVSDPIWNGLESLTEKVAQDRSALAGLPRSGRTLRTPTFTLTSGAVACRVFGTGHVVACVDSHRLIAGPLHNQTVVPIKAEDEWVELDLRRYVGHRLHLEFTPAEHAQLEVHFITQGASKQIRGQLSRYASLIAHTVAQFATSAEQALGKDLDELVKAWASERSSLQAQIMGRSRLAMAMLDGTGEDDHILIRGNASKPGEVEPRHFLTAVSGNQAMLIPAGSGRLELARQINDPANPLTTRVIVNRIWHHLMGRGIVPTTDDFGVLGQRPSHPELLDYLATRFVEDGQSIKQLIRRIVLTRTYQMSSQPSAEALAADPKNLLWHHRPPMRLEGEVIRDALLSLSGQLDASFYGESIPIYLTPFMDGRGRPEQSGPMDGARRRSIYTAVRRNFLSPFMLTFDTPAPFSTMGRRNVSNVPAQALILMNDPLVVEQAGKWAELAIGQPGSLASRVEWMYQAAFARQVTRQELDVATKYLRSESDERNVPAEDLKLWTDLAHALINTKEFIFLR